MNDRKAIRRLILGALIFLAPLALMQQARAVIIEGFDSAGNFLAVNVTSDGRLQVASATGTVIGVFFISSQPVNAFQATSPWIVAPDGLAEWEVVQKPGDVWDVNIVSGGGGGSGGEVVTTPSTTTVMLFGQTAIPAVSATLVSASDPDHRQRLICSLSTVNIYLGPAASVTDLNGTLLAPGACYTPDSPITYAGDLFAYSTAAARVSFQAVQAP
jgi:hypothetical protein